MSAGVFQGTMIAVVGPSGAGKDSLIDFARQRLSDDPTIGFVRRVITRPAEAGGEDHHAVSVDQFEAMRQTGSFAVHWGAHGLFYGIPAETRQHLASGKILVANGSRAAIPDFLQAYPKTLVVNITAAPEIIARRLAARGRETADEIELRLLRSANTWQLDCRHVVIDNSGDLQVAGNTLVSTILELSQPKIAAV